MDKIKIGYKIYEVEEVEPNSILMASSDECYGQIHYHDKKIYLNSKYDEDQKKSTLIHEVIHGLDEMYVIELDESQVEKLGIAITILLKDNNLKVVKNG